MNIPVAYCSNSLGEGATGFIRFSLFLPKGKALRESIRILGADLEQLDFTLSVVGLWPDNTVKTCLVEIPAPVKGAIYFSSELSDLSVRKLVFPVDEQNDAITVRLAEQALIVSKSQPGFCGSLLSDPLLKLKGVDGSTLLGRVEHISYSHHLGVVSGDPVSVDLIQQGCFYRGTERLANFELSLKFYCVEGRVECALSLHNFQAAEHPAGAWDLGDGNSLLFEAFSISWGLPEGISVSCFDELSGESFDGGGAAFSVYQESSGGKHWQSPNHMNSRGIVPFKQQGYTLQLGGECLQGQRIQPVVSARTGSGESISLSLENFWQQFPSEISVADNRLELSLFPEAFPDLHELQPGEKKTHKFFLSLEEKGLSGRPLMSSKPDVTLNPQWVECCEVLPWFGLPSGDEDPIAAIITEGLLGPKSFLQKREQIDQYGWRHYGELYADHEAEGENSNEVFVSHYNNQYDSIYGLYRQAIITGNSSYLTQASELARHVTDIDIYDTYLDKDDYNQGLFWHTDHYQKAETCTHRTYSKHHQSGAYEDHLGGGGPGGQHCYTTGLLLDYWLTGNEASKQAVLGLGKWITNVYEGKGTLLEFLLAWKNRYRHDLKSFWTGRYPLDRGIGNYINALLDCYCLTTQASYLDRVAHIIQKTVHPSDDIALRNFGDVEETWFYTVFFQALARFLWIKLEREEVDEDFLYARDSLSHYALWMSEHECLSLDHPEKLEFPNITWTAQDLRKVNVLYLASYFDQPNKATFEAKAEQLFERVVASLSQDETRFSTRVMAILMQNHGTREWVRKANAPQLPATRSHAAASFDSARAKFLYVVGGFIKAIAGLSLPKELDQLRKRFPKLTKYIGPVHVRS